MPQSDRSEYHRRYRENNRELLRSKDKSRRDRQRIARRKRTYGKRLPKCQFCGILLTSKLAGKKAWKYCVKCRRDPKVRRYLRAAYQRRFHQKKRGDVVAPLTLAEDIVQ